MRKAEAETRASAMSAARRKWDEEMGLQLTALQQALEDEKDAQVRSVKKQGDAELVAAVASAMSDAEETR